MDKLFNEIVAINRYLGGTLVRKSGLAFATETGKYKRLSLRLALVLRAIVVYHPFDDFNKSTASVITKRMLNREGYNVNVDCMQSKILFIAKNSITDLDKIVGLIKKCYRKKK